MNSRLRNGLTLQIFNIDGTRTNVAIDLLNLFNANTGTAFEQNYGDGVAVSASD